MDVSVDAGHFASSKLLTAEHFGSNGTGQNSTVVDGPFASQFSRCPSTSTSLNATCFYYTDMQLHLGPDGSNTLHTLTRILDESNSTFAGQE